MEQSKLISVELAALIEDQATSSPIVILHDRARERILPIWIGDPEARAIAVALDRMKMPRPLTHKLFINAVKQMGGELIRIVVDRIKNHTYYATVYIGLQSGETAVDARPSDAIALALEAGAPIFVDSAVMDAASQNNPFPAIANQREKKGLELNQDELVKLKDMLEKARMREQQS